MRIALFSDIHGHVTGLKAVLARLKWLGGADAVYCLGDMIGGGLGLDDVLDLLLEHNVQMARGNWDEVFVDLDAHLAHLPVEHHADVRRTYEWSSSRLSSAHQRLLADLPLSHTVEIAPRHTLFLCHAAPDDAWASICRADTPVDELRRTFDGVDAQVIAYGHYHAHHVRQMDEKLLINVASVGLGWYGLAALTMLDYADDQLTVRQYQVPYDMAAHERMVKERQMPDSPAIWYWRD
ncbi:MAG: metallophosphoesterase family protein [Caldilineaceae bacterium]